MDIIILASINKASYKLALFSKITDKILRKYQGDINVLISLVNDIEIKTNTNFLINLEEPICDSQIKKLESLIKDKNGLIKYSYFDYYELEALASNYIFNLKGNFLVYYNLSKSDEFKIVFNNKLYKGNNNKAGNLKDLNIEGFFGDMLSTKDFGWISRYIKKYNIYYNTILNTNSSFYELCSAYLINDYVGVIIIDWFIDEMIRLIHYVENVMDPGFFVIGTVNNVDVLEVLDRLISKYHFKFPDSKLKIVNTNKIDILVGLINHE